MEQLHSLVPRAGAFEKAGIPIVTIGSDTVDQVKASMQVAIENDDPPLPFPVLCDPEGVAFKAYGCWNEFDDEALHGTFLVDADGRIRWQDISAWPFMETDFLLAECVQLLGMPATDAK